MPKKKAEAYEEIISGQNDRKGQDTCKARLSQVVWADEGQ